MTLIEAFIARYRKEFDFYDQAARLAAQTLETILQAEGIRSMVTSRAKSPVRLEEKIHQRAKNKTYVNVEDIYNDIVDLAGARVALYFPGEREQVDLLIKNAFVPLAPPKKFPTGDAPIYDKRFQGYFATHYRVQMREASLSDAQKRYSEARIEIQVASVLMHAWAEVEHDLVYKPLQGRLSDDEYAVLDQLNGLVMAGEVGLERLQKAGEGRVAASGRMFANHFDLAAYLVNRAAHLIGGKPGDRALGRVDLLFELLLRLNKATPEGLTPYVAVLHSDTEKRPISEQIVDQILAEDEPRYKIYEEIRQATQTLKGSAPETGLPEENTHEAIGHFIGEWIALEHYVRELKPPTGKLADRVLIPTGKILEELGLLDPRNREEFERIRRLRNNLVHGVESRDAADIREAAQQLRHVVRFPAGTLAGRRGAHNGENGHNS